MNPSWQSLRNLPSKHRRHVLLLFHLPIMKLNVANPATGAQKLFDFDDDRKVRVFMEKKMGQEVPADSLGDEWKG